MNAAFFGGAVVGALLIGSVLVIYMNLLQRRRAVSKRRNKRDLQTLREVQSAPPAVTRVLVKEREIHIP